jgi:hypothetical protein
MKRLQFQNGTVVDSDSPDPDKSPVCAECGRPLEHHAELRNGELFCSVNCADDYCDRRVIE